MKFSAANSILKGLQEIAKGEVRMSCISIEDYAIVKKAPLSDLLEVGVLTGSRVIGGASDQSDWDIVVPINFQEQARAIVEPWSYSKMESNYFAGVKYSISSEKEINLIFVHTHEFKAWVLATKALEDTLRLAGKPSKAQRRDIFQALMIQFRSILPELGGAEAYNEENMKWIRNKAVGSKALASFYENFLEYK